jgi:arginase
MARACCLSRQSAGLSFCLIDAYRVVDVHRPTVIHLLAVSADPRETDDAGRSYLAGAGVSLQEAPAFVADPSGAAARAISAVAAASGPVVVHFDVDSIDSGDLPLGNFPHYGSGVLFEHIVACLRVLRQHPSFAGLVLTEVNPTHDAEGSQLGRYVDGIARALAA